MTNQQMEKIEEILEPYGYKLRSIYDPRVYSSLTKNNYIGFVIGPRGVSFKFYSGYLSNLELWRQINDVRIIVQTLRANKLPIAE